MIQNEPYYACTHWRPPSQVYLLGPRQANSGGRNLGPREASPQSAQSEVAGSREVGGEGSAAARRVIHARMQNEDVAPKVEIEALLDDQIEPTAREAADSNQEWRRSRQRLKRTEH